MATATVSYANSENVKAFPTTKRSPTYRESRLLQEENLIGIVNRLLDVDSFIISKELVEEGAIDGRTVYSVEFNIHGYYFKVYDITEPITYSGEEYVGIIDSSWTNLYVGIGVVDSSGYKELRGTDISFEFQGETVTQYQSLFFSNSETTLKDYIAQFVSEADGDKIYTMHLLVKNGTTWAVNPDALAKYTMDRLSIGNIDGGVIS